MFFYGPAELYVCLRSTVLFSPSRARRCPAVPDPTVGRENPHLRDHLLHSRDVVGVEAAPILHNAMQPSRRDIRVLHCRGATVGTVAARQCSTCPGATRAATKTIKATVHKLRCAVAARQGLHKLTLKCFKNAPRHSEGGLCMLHFKIASDVLANAPPHTGGLT